MPGAASRSGPGCKVQYCVKGALTFQGELIFAQEVVPYRERERGAGPGLQDEEAARGISAQGVGLDLLVVLLALSIVPFHLVRPAPTKKARGSDELVRAFSMGVV